MKAFVQRFFSPLVWSGIVSAALISVNPIAVHADSDDPPSRVARLGSLEGTVSIQPAGVNEWSTASSNYPVSTGDRVYTDDNARAELQIGQTVARMWKDTDLSVTNLSDNMTQLGLAQGSLRLRTFGMDPQTQIEIDTPNGALLVTQPGDFRVDAYNGDYGTVVTVNSGELELTGPDLQQRINSGQSLRLTGTNPIQVSGMQMPSVDQFDGWSLDRDRRLENSQSAQYVSRDAPGYDDLDDYGDWSPQTEYGPVWYPRNVPVGWVPYRYGHWVWTGPWGWTWVADEPWGYAPFHYGRWAYVRNRWGWVPGPVAVRPIWSPALVAFVGGPHFGVSVGVGGGYGDAAWFPLGPGEPYSPWYRSSPRYVNQVNITNIRVTRVVNVQNDYNRHDYNNVRYSHRENGMTAVNGRDFSTARPVAQNMLRVNPHQFAQAPVTKPEFKPTTQSVVPRPIHNARVEPARPVLLTQGGKEAQAVPGARPQPVPLRPLPTSTVQQGGGPRPVGAGNNPPRPTTIQPPHVGQAPVRVQDNPVQNNQPGGQNGTHQTTTPVQPGNQPGRTPAPGTNTGTPNRQAGQDQQPHPGNPSPNPVQPGNQPGRPPAPTLNSNRPAEPGQPVHATPIPAPAAPTSAAPQRQEEIQPRPQGPNQPARTPAPTLGPGAPNRPPTPEQIHPTPVPAPAAPANAAPHRQDEVQPRPQAPNQPQQVQPPPQRQSVPVQRPPYQPQQPPPQNNVPIPPQQAQPPQHTAPTPPPMRQIEQPQRTAPPPPQQVQPPQQRQEVPPQRVAPPPQQRQEVPPQRVAPPPPQQVQPPQQRQELPPQHAAPTPPPMRQEMPPQHAAPPPQQRQEIPQPQHASPPPQQQRQHKRTSAATATCCAASTTAAQRASTAGAS